MNNNSAGCRMFLSILGKFSAKCRSYMNKKINTINHTWHTDPLDLKNRWEKIWGEIDIKWKKTPVDFFLNTDYNREQYNFLAEECFKQINKQIDSYGESLTEEERIDYTLCLLDLIRFTPDLHDLTEKINGYTFLDFIPASKTEDREYKKSNELKNSIVQLIVFMSNNFFVDKHGVKSKAKFKFLRNNYKTKDLFYDDKTISKSFIILPDDRGDIHIKFNDIDAVFL